MSEPVDVGVSLAEPPHSIASAKVDDKGRLKLPSESLDWCKKSNIANVFITTFDKVTVRIYPIPLWKSTVKLLEEKGVNATAGKALATIAKNYGGDAEIDAQGRILLPSALRTLLGLESKTICLEHLAGRMDFTIKALFDEILAKAEENLEEKLETFRQLGL